MITLSPDDPGGGTLRDLAPDLTPMLDILFILLVFFMLTAGAVFHSLDLTLPSSVEEEVTLVNEPKHILLEIREAGYGLDGTDFATFEGLKKALAKAHDAKPDYEMIVAGDKHISIEKLLKVLTYLRSRGIEAANILMQKEPDQ
ncbi:MAG: hypothetical protein EP348_03865 [Alphaproteobacteria bacterium]|nr:MAG: hypothetical protein EP348_03865 [Alphaproteobacteria bacterium]